MKLSWLACGALAIFWGAILGAAFYDDPREEESVVVDNKCQCVKVTSKFVPSKDNPEEQVLERNIRIIVPLKSRENISDPTSPTRTRFVYKLSKLCNKCDTAAATVDEEGIVAGKRTPCDDPDEPCYTYDRNKCYTASTPFLHAGKTQLITTALNPESCYPD
ncbi:PREDICTED: immunoglobulin J chain [Gekko japonicus]|uniref:immunoglobulin J chain n=1 Tax=Gekko japonicus TaxID=146911 RepID=UPI00074FCE18|nr:PREDICTED: immunoglobulin J chain [Gekko japonicus]